MKILLVYNNMHKVGGIQTFLLRMVRHLRARGVDVELLTSPPRDHFGGDSAILRRIGELTSVHYSKLTYRASRRALRRLEIPECDVLYCCNTPSLLLGFALQQARLPQARVIAGVYHPREYASIRGPKQVEDRVVEELMQFIPVENLFFMTEGMKRQMGECLERDFSRSPLIPLGVDTDLARSGERQVKRHKIVSIARLTEYYTHNFHLIDVVAGLRARGTCVECHIHGEGPARPALEKRISELGLGGRVRLHGKLDYSNFDEAVADAGVFIGTGTSLVEAAVRGIPSLVAIESHREPTCYGFFSHHHGVELGGYIPGEPEYQISEKLEELLALAPQAYAQLEAASRERALEFSMERFTQRYLRALKMSREFSFNFSHRMRAQGHLDRIYWSIRARVGMTKQLDSRYHRFGT